MCISPNSLKIPVSWKGFSASKVVSVPCGHCYECVRKRKLDWEIRLTVESSASAHTFFGMLTYSDEFYHSDVDRNEIAYYIKRLRYNLDKYYPGATLKYFLVSELGELKDRLHYHVLYFVSSEFTDTHREFEELCKLSWVKKVPLSQESIDYRKRCFKSWCKRFKPNNQINDFLEYRKWSRRRFDDISIGFATCQMLRGGSAVGSIHYACKYIQKQYNRMFYSRLGYNAWIKHMIDEGKFEYNFEGTTICKTHLLDYPTFPVRGKHYPVPKRWLINSIGGYMTKYFSCKLAQKYSTKDKEVDNTRLERFWFDEPERLALLKEKESLRIQSRVSAFEERLAFLSAIQTDIDEWLMSTTPRRSLNCPVDVNSTFHTETLLPLKWV